MRDAAKTRVADGGHGGGEGAVEDCRHFMTSGAHGRVLIPFELGRAPYPPGRLRGGAARAGRAGCCCRLG